jgi:hypothetical protein
MNKEFISKLGQYSLSRIIEFGEFYKNDNIGETSYENWNVRDVIGHINRWVKFSSDKLESIKTKQTFEDIEYKDIENFNKTNYEKFKSKSLEDIIKESKILFQNYENVLNQYTNDELLSKEFPTGFPCSLWEYMALDLFIHPINHIIYQYIKRKNYNEFITEVEKSKDYSNSNVEIYKFSNLFEQEKEKILNELLDIVKNRDNKFVEEIIKINMM